jgi:hypothetical protein
VKALGDRIREAFPDFRENPYYLKLTDPEERKYIELQQRNTLLFILKYRALWFYRDMRKALSRRG